MSLHSTPNSPSKPTADKRRETAERMRKWRASNAEKNRDNDTRCRVYRVARERFGMADTPAKAAWIHEEIIRRTERRRLRDAKKLNSVLSTSSATSPTQIDSTGRAFLAWLPIDIKKKYSKPVATSSPFPNLPPLSDPTPFNPIHLPSMEPTNQTNLLDYTSSQAVTRLNLAAVHFLIA